MRSLFHHRLVRKHFSQLWRFAVCGGIGASIDIGSLTLFVEYFHIPSRIAFLPSSLLAVTFVFLANKYFTFANHEKQYANQLLKFALVYGLAFALNLTITYGLFWVGMRMFLGPLREIHIAILSKVLAIGFGAIWNYVLSHGFVFKKSEPIDIVVT